MSDKSKKRRGRRLNGKLNIPYQTMRRIKRGDVINFKGVTLMRRSEHELSNLERFLMDLVVNSLLKEENFKDLVKKIVENVAGVLNASSWVVLEVMGSGELRTVCSFKMRIGDDPKILETVEKGETVLERNRVIIPVSIDEETILVIVFKWEDRGVRDVRMFEMLKEKLDGILRNSVRLRNVFEERYRDHLTGALNRKALERDLKNLNGYSVIFIDIDDFKAINDKFGHKVGDEILKKLSVILRSSLRSMDRVYRYGGDEFVILLPKTDLETAEEIAKRLKKASSDISINGIPLSISTGVASSSEGTGRIVSKADERMYKEKREKRKSAS